MRSLGEVTRGGALTRASLLDALDATGPIDLPTALVVAHPDDESVALAGTLARFRQLTLIHATDGAPDEAPGGHLGLSRAELAALRRSETLDALRSSLCAPISHLWYGFTDAGIVELFEQLVERLTADLADAEAVITHAFEGGHIDHDTCSLAVHLACTKLASASGRSPVRYEFSGYYPRFGKPCADGFSPVYSTESRTIRLNPSGRQRREMAFACHRSQQGVLQLFDLATERFRLAPNYEYTTSLPELLYPPSEAQKLQTIINHHFASFAGGPC